MRNLFRAGLAALALAGVVSASVTTAHAGHRPHKEDGEAKVLGVGPEARKAAIAAAIADWKREVREDTGRTPLWRTATEKEIKCKTKRASKTKCEVEARPQF